MKTKEKILASALRLFNTDGVENVTTRHIAAEIGISQGNLHYHYPNKNEVIIALYRDFMNRLEGARRYNAQKVFKKEDVLASMKENFKIMNAYCFFFKDNEVVWRRLPAIQKDMIALLQHKKNEIKAIINQYTQQGIFRTDISKHQIEFLAEQFIFTISAWLTASEYMNKTTDAAFYFSIFAFRQWLPYLTQEAMREWEDIL